MSHPRSHRRRVPRDWDEEEDDTPTFVEVLISSLTDRFAHSAVNRLKYGVQGAVQWTLKRIIAGWIGTAILMAGILLVLFAGVKGLEALNCPLWLAYLSMGTVALIGSLLVLRATLSTPEEED